MKGILFLVLASLLKTEPLNPSDLTERFNAQRKENMRLEEKLRKEEKKEEEREKIKQQKKAKSQEEREIKKTKEKRARGKGKKENEKKKEKREGQKEADQKAKGENKEAKKRSEQEIREKKTNTQEEDTEMKKKREKGEEIKEGEIDKGIEQKIKQEKTIKQKTPKTQEPFNPPKQEQSKQPTQPPKTSQESISQNQAKQAPCFIIHRISLQTSFKKEEFDFLNPILEKYNHTCIQQDHLTALLKELQLEAVKQGYVTTFFALAPQDLKSGELIIALESSVVGKINHNSLIAFWGKDFGINEGDILNIQPLERGIYYYKRLRTLTPKFLLQSLPSQKEEAQTQIDVIFETKKLGDVSMPLYALLTFDNGGNQGSGIHQNSLQFGLENLLSLNEAFNSYSVITPDWQEKRHSLYTSLDFSIPIRRFLFSISGSYSSYAYPLFLGKKELKYHGYSANLDLKGKILLYLDQLNQVSMTFGLAKRWAKNFLETIELITQRRNLTQIYASVDYSKTFSNNASISLSLGVRQGVKILGSMSNFPSSDQKPPDFFYTLPTLDSSLYLPFSLGKHRFLYFGVIKTQISRTQLYASEKMGLGGSYSVRGFDSAALNGDFGVLYRNDLTYYPTSLKGLMIAPSLGIDLGFVSDVFNPASEELGNKGFLSGGGFGFKISFKEYFQAQVWGYFPFYNPRKQKERNFYFSLSCGF